MKGWKNATRDPNSAQYDPNTQGAEPAPSIGDGDTHSKRISAGTRSRTDRLQSVQKALGNNAAQAKTKKSRPQRNERKKVGGKKTQRTRPRLGCVERLLAQLVLDRIVSRYTEEGKSEEGRKGAGERVDG
jgi:hypothetical protein